MEHRIAELETQLAFQENTIRELNDVVIKQQQQIDLLTKELGTVKKELRSILSSNIASADQETPPPHY